MAQPADIAQIKSIFSGKSSFNTLLDSIGLNLAKAKDANGDGVLTVDEDIAYLKKHNPKLTEAEITKIRELYDANSGSIAVEDYLAVATKQVDTAGTLVEHERKVDEAAAKLADSPYGPMILNLFGKQKHNSGISPQEKGLDSLKGLMDILSEFISQLGNLDGKKAATPSNISPAINPANQK